MVFPYHYHQSVRASIGLCGIEIFFEDVHMKGQAMASIGLCGIEILFVAIGDSILAGASIGLCGIEIHIHLHVFLLAKSFNRTVWY